MLTPVSIADTLLAGRMIAAVVAVIILERKTDRDTEKGAFVSVAEEDDWACSTSFRTDKR